MIFEVRDGGFGYSSHECILKNVNFSLDEPQVLSVPVSYTHLDVYKRQIWLCGKVQSFIIS